MIVPPEKRVLNVEVLPSQPEYKPGQKATVKVKLTDFFGKPFQGTTLMTVCLTAVPSTSRGGSNVRGDSRNFTGTGVAITNPQPSSEPQPLVHQP